MQVLEIQYDENTGRPLEDEYGDFVVEPTDVIAMSEVERQGFTSDDNFLMDQLEEEIYEEELNELQYQYYYGASL